jgi:multiple sugar transport system substrate-binding protein
MKKIISNTIGIAAFVLIAFVNNIFAAEQCRDKTINVLLLQQDSFQNIADQKSDIESNPGIRVNYEILPEKALTTKMQLSLASKTGEYDVVSSSTRWLGSMVSGGWIQGIDNFLNNENMTPTSWEYDGLVERLVENLGVDGVRYGLPQASESNILYYNKKMFAEAGLTRPPKTLEELMGYAAILNKPEVDQAGIVMRATREGGTNGYAWIMIWKMFGGDWYAKSDVPFAVLDRPEAIHATNFFTKMLNNFGPPGISSYGWQEALLSFQQGKAAMMVDASAFGSKVEDPSQSKVSGNVGYAVLDGRGDKTTVGPIWGFFMPTTVNNEIAPCAWEWMKWATSESTQLEGVRSGMNGNPTRHTVLQSDIFKQKNNPEWITALVKALGSSDPAYTPLAPEGGEIRSVL